MIWKAMAIGALFGAIGCALASPDRYGREPLYRLWIPAGAAIGFFAGCFLVYT